MSFQEEPILKIAIRRGSEVSIHGIPWNLTRAEAEKVVAVIQAFVTLPKPPLDTEKTV